MGIKIINLSLRDLAIIQDFEDKNTLASNPILKKEMVEYLDDLLHEKDKSYINDLIKKYPEKWSTHLSSSSNQTFHLRGGMVVRNLLRDAGFTEDKIGIANLDNVYVSLLEEVIKRSNF